MMKLKKYLMAILLSISALASANDNPQVMYDVMPYIGARAPDWVLNINKEESSSSKIIKTIVYAKDDNTYTYTLFDDILYSVEVRLNTKKNDWTVEEQYKKLGIAHGVADSLIANGFKMSKDNNNTKMRLFDKGDIKIVLDNYQTQFLSNSQDPAITLVITNNKFVEQVKKHQEDILSRLAVEHKNTYKDLIGK